MEPAGLRAADRNGILSRDWFDDDPPRSWSSLIYVYRSIQNIMVECLPNAETGAIQGLGHLGPMLHPGAFNTVIARSPAAMELAGNQ